MSITNDARLSPFKQKPLHPEYRRRAAEIAEIPYKVLRANPRYLPMCPYCGTENTLTGSVKIGSKDMEYNIPLTIRGIELPYDPGTRTVELTIAECSACEAAIEAEAFRAPVWFVEDRIRTLEMVRPLKSSNPS